MLTRGDCVLLEVLDGVFVDTPIVGDTALLIRGAVVYVSPLQDELAEWPHALGVRPVGEDVRGAGAGHILDGTSPEAVQLIRSIEVHLAAERRVVPGAREEVCPGGVITGEGAAQVEGADLARVATGHEGHPRGHAEG